ncbi:replication protein A 70 kDa DNA-binding subunit C-like [Trifolium pratense]|uniref:replication protein A 70 kDa DNA-binding subunit C-like n=1 Tax=Trifolium pratense TaxID=57577 RepID=UPI001E693C34|nr:replication protein A 70 kDa DNA-binding subunit C-like [Trifolium pratense]
MVFNDRMKMEGKFEDVAGISPGREVGTIKVRVLRLWKVPAFMNPNETSSLKMVLGDEKGGKIHAFVRKQLIGLFDSKLEEGGVYEISGFFVLSENGVYRTTLHPYKIGFQSRTKVRSCESSGISQFGLSFTNIGEISSHSRDYDFLVDVIGVMTGIHAEREYIRDGKITKMVTIELTDHTGKCDCALFGEYVDELNKKIGKFSPGLPIVVVQYMKVKIFREKASIQNVMNATRLMINPDIPEVESFKNSIDVHGIDCDADVPLIGEPPKPPFEEEFLRMHPKKTIAELGDVVDDGVFVVCGEVVGVVDGHNWWYPACKCHRAVVVDSGTYFCSSCDRHVFHVIPRFRVKFEVADGDSSCVFVLFDSEMSYIVEKSCAFFVAQSKGKNVGPHPMEFDSLVGKRMLFVVSKSGKPSAVDDGSFRVKRVCMDPVIVEKFLADIGFSTPKRLSPIIDLESDGVSDDCRSVEGAEDVDQFLKDLIVNPPDACEADDDDPDAAFVVKRNLSKAFDGAAKPKRSIRLKKVKIKKE